MVFINKIFLNWKTKFIGSAPTFYFRKGSDTGANNFMIYFEGGGVKLKKN